MEDKALLEFKEQRGKLIADNRADIEAREKLGEEITAEDQQKIDKRFTDADALKAKIDLEERQREAEANLAASAGRKTATAEPENRGAGGEPENRAVSSLVERTSTGNHEVRYRQIQGENGPAYESRYMQGSGREQCLTFEGHNTTDEYRSMFNKYIRGQQMTPEERALNNTVLTAGGALTPDMEFSSELIKFVDDAVLVRQFARMFTLPSADSLGFPSLDNDPADGTWTSELLTGSADTTMSFGRREFVPNPNAERILVSKTLIRKAPGAETLVRERLAYKMSVTQEKAYLTGDGANKPLGVFTADANGISTGRDVSTGNTTTAIGADNLRRQKYNLKPQYRTRARWMFHRDGVRGISILKDGNGQYLWQPGLTLGDPDVLLNMPVMESEYAPNTFTTGLYVGILGAWDNYWIVDALDFEILALRELKAETNQDEFIIRHEGDGMPVLEQAWSRVKLG